MPPSSRKRNKGKDRKAKQVAKKEEKDRADASALWRNLCSIIAGCDHGCDVIPAYDHPVSNFMDQFYINLQHKRNDIFDHVISKTLKELFKSHIQIWNNESYRRLVLDILIRIGTNELLCGGGVWRFGFGSVCLAQSIVVLEHFCGSGGSINSVMNSRVVISKRRDLECGASSIKRDTLKFFRKRTSCKCLKKMHLDARKTEPKMGKCFHCKVEMERISLSLCCRCMVFQYCSRECQLADWSAHERNCGILVHQNNKR